MNVPDEIVRLDLKKEDLSFDELEELQALLEEVQVANGENINQRCYRLGLNY